ncbi:MAG: TrmH family RNA methyltransferase [Treponema sp.]|nr:TrmH family RNA methyltransferase [Treponema sp.]
MIEPGKLFQLEGGQRRRKLALTLGALERDILGIAEKGSEYNFSSMTRKEYIRKIIEIVLADKSLPKNARLELSSLLDSPILDERKVCNCAKNHLLALLGTFPAEWDLVIAPHARPLTQNNVQEQAIGFENSIVPSRNFFEGVCVYAEDIRSPFNLGSIFRSAESLGAEKVYISPSCTSPEHKRAIRSSMGCIESIGYERMSLEELPHDLPIFALETGGTPLNEFTFPKKGICLIGSEELGLSPEALAKATYGHVTIPSVGLKASLNVGVAFGILLQKWTESIKCE